MENVSHTGGHLASNLGSVELTVALHRVYDPMKDRILFDVGHQSYVHKILTGRRDSFDTLRQLDGVSGFPKPCESNADPFLAGHASDSVSLAAGMARARTLMHGNYDVVAVVGDGAMTGGLCFEGLSDLGASREAAVVVLNDNGMSINEKCRRRGEIAPPCTHAPWISPLQADVPPRYEKSTRTPMKSCTGSRSASKRTFCRPVYLTISGFTISGRWTATMKRRSKRRCAGRRIFIARSLCMVTVKGKGYAPAEADPQTYHGVNPFDRKTGVTTVPANDFFCGIRCIGDCACGKGPDGMRRYRGDGTRHGAVRICPPFSEPLF